MTLGIEHIHKPHHNDYKPLGELDQCCINNLDLSEKCSTPESAARRASDPGQRARLQLRKHGFWIEQPNPVERSTSPSTEAKVG